jgi:RND family efflux transporter MFP subunit
MSAIGRVVGGLLFVLGMFLVGVWLFKRDVAPMPVRMHVVQAGPIESTLAATGTVVASRELTVAAPVAGRLASLNVVQGQQVGKDASLAMFDTTAARATLAQSSAEASRIRLEVAQLEQSSYAAHRLLEVGGASAAEVQEKNSQLNQARERLRAMLAGTRLAELAIDTHRIRAPYDGVVVKVHAVAGQYLPAGATLLSLADVSTRNIEMKVDVGDATLLRAGQPARVNAESLGQLTWDERVLRLAPSVDSTNNISVHLSLGSQGASLRLGQQIDVRITLASKPAAVKVPLGAVQNQEGRTLVATVRDGRIHHEPVSTGIEDLGFIEILSGLKPGQQIAIPGAARLRDGDRVVAREVAREATKERARNDPH